MPAGKKIPIACFLLALTFLAGTNLPAEAQGQQPPSQDVVVLVDCSNSMEPYIQPLIDVLTRFVDGSRIGDSFTCYRFSKDPVTVSSKRITNLGDIALIKTQLQTMRVRGAQTNYATALDRAMQDVAASYAKYGENERVLILITDGRRHPTDPQSEDKALAQLVTKYSRMKPEEDYSFYSFYIGGLPEDDLQKFYNKTEAYSMTWPDDTRWLENLTIADVRIMESSLFLGYIPQVPSNLEFSLDFFPRRPPTGTILIQLDTQTNFGETTLDRYFEVTPRHIVCRTTPWKEEFSLRTRGFDKGTFSGSFMFKPSRPEVFLLYPRVVEFKFAISGVLRVDVPMSLVFGPTGLKGNFSETKQISIAPGRAGLPGSANAVSVDSEIELPEGVELKLTKRMSAEGIVVEVAVLRKKKIDARAAGRYKGKLIITAQEGWRLSDNEIPITVDVSQASTTSRDIAIYVLFAGGSLGAIAVLLLFFTRARKSIMGFISPQESPTGKLVLVYDPTKGTASNINLDRLCEDRHIKEVTVGIGPGSLVELSHISLMDKTYSFTGKKDVEGIHTVVTAGQGRDEVIINDMSRTGEITLKHLDKLKLGAFEYRFEMPRPLRQVVLYYLDGETKQGWLRSWNTNAEGFHLIPRGGGKKEIYVRYYELKTVAFVRDFDGELCQRVLALQAPRSGHHVRIFLAGEEELTGYVLDWQDPGEKFYFFPDSMGDNVLFFLLESSSIRNLALLREDEKGSQKAKKALYDLLNEMKKLVAV